MNAHPRLVWGAALAALGLVFAGCVGDFRVRQTEPIKVQLDGASQTATVKESDDEPQKFLVENTKDVEQVEVNVEVTQVSSTPVTIMVTVQDGDTNETLATKEVVVGGDNATPTETGNATSPAPAPGGERDKAEESIVVNVKGKDNIVIITQAEQGTAEVNVAAREATMMAPPEASPTGTPYTTAAP